MVRAASLVVCAQKGASAHSWLPLSVQGSTQQVARSSHFYFPSFLAHMPRNLAAFALALLGPGLAPPLCCAWFLFACGQPSQRQRPLKAARGLGLPYLSNLPPRRAQGALCSYPTDPSRATYCHRYVIEHFPLPRKRQGTKALQAKWGSTFLLWR